MPSMEPPNYAQLASMAHALGDLSAQESAERAAVEETAMASIREAEERESGGEMSEADAAMRGLNFDSAMRNGPSRRVR